MPSGTEDGARRRRGVRRSLLAILLFAVASANCSAGSAIQGAEPPTGPVAFLVLHLSKSTACEHQGRDARCRRVAVTNIGEASGPGSCTLFPRRGSTAAFAGGGSSADVPDLAPGSSTTVGILVIRRGHGGEFWNPGTMCQPGQAMV